MPNLVPFAFEDNLVRSCLDENGEPWFVAKDVCRVLGIENNRDAISSLDEDEKITVANPDGNPRAGIPHQYTLISESGLYALIFRSRKPQARAFSKWVRAEVLPALRTSGHYETPGYRERMEQYRSDSAPQPEAARYLRPAMRERLLSSAIQTAKMCGNTDPAFVDGLYARYCVMVAGDVQSAADRDASPETPLHREEQAALVHRFVKERCTVARGMKKSATRLYAAFREWWQGQTATPPASQRLFGMILKEYFPSRRRGGHFWYYDMALVDE